MTDQMVTRTGEWSLGDTAGLLGVRVIPAAQIEAEVADDVRRIGGAK